MLDTLPSLVAGSLLVAFCDNVSVTHALARGGGHHPECHLLIGKVWRSLAEHDCDMQVARVEIASSISGGPFSTNLFLKHLESSLAKLFHWFYHAG